ncbi:MAG: (2Fe-2S) ferredoxin domain-containing protein [Firmicutes bacterium]|nr:(2Fe-2S) ferredoxin domain-containing protein [Bacillota bacterium]
MKSLEELRAIKERMQGHIGVRADSSEDTRVVVGMATCGIASGARPVLNRLVEEVHDRKLENVTVSQTGCIGLCQFEPIVEVYEPGKDKITYIKMDADKAAVVVEKHLMGGTPVAEYMLESEYR